MSWKFYHSGEERLVQRSSCVTVVPELQADGQAPRWMAGSGQLVVQGQSHYPSFFSPNLDQPRGGRASQSEARTKQVSSGQVQKPEKGTDRLPAGGEHQPAPRVPPGPGPTEPNRGLGSREHEKLLHTPPSSLFKGKSWGKDKEMWIKNELPPVDDGACF